MKKISKILGMIACAFVLVLSGTLLTACGGANPYSVKGVTLNGTAEITVVWWEEATQEEKNKAWEIFGSGATNDSEFEQNLSEEWGEHYAATWIDFKEDGSFTAYLNESEISGYYVQSEDLKSISLYEDAEHTEYLYYTFDYVDGTFRLDLNSDGHMTLYVAYQKA